MRARIAERADHVEELDDGPRPPVEHEQRGRVLLGRLHMEEVHTLAVDGRDVLGPCVEASLERPPVEGFAPGAGKVLEVIERYAPLPPGAWKGSRPAGVGETRPEVLDLAL